METPNFQVQEKAIVRFTPTAASQTLIKHFISFPHCVCCTWRSLSVWDCFVNADAVWWRWVILITFSRPVEYLWDHQTPVSFIWHLSSCFISVNGVFPLSIPAAQRKKPEGYWLLFTSQHHIFFSPFTQSLVRFSFFGAGTKFLWSLGKSPKWGNNIDVCLHTVVSVLPYRGLGYTVFWVKLSSRNPFLHYAWQQTDIKQHGGDWKRSYQASLLFAFDGGKKKRKTVDDLIKQLVSFCMNLFIL